MKFVQNARVKRIIEGINFPLGVPVEVPDGYPIRAEDMVAMGFTIVAPVGDPDTTPIISEAAIGTPPAITPLPDPIPPPGPELPGNRTPHHDHRPDPPKRKSP